MFEQAIDAAISEHPELTAFGFGTYAGRDTFEHDRKQLFACREAFNAAVLFIATVGLRQTIDRRRDTYGLKHRCEAWLGRTIWIPNGVFIAALHYCGAKLERCGPNAFCNLKAVQL